MHKSKYGIKPRIFLPNFRELDHQYQQAFPKAASIIKDLVVKPRALQ